MSGNWITKPRRYAIYERDNCQCVYCGVQVIPGKSSLAGKDNLATLDHIIPRNHGGKNTTDNLVCACLSCNSSRKDKALFEYLNGDVTRIMKVIKQACKQERV